MSKRLLFPVLNETVDFSGEKYLSLSKEVHFRNANTQEFYILHDQAHEYGMTSPPTTDSIWLIKEMATAPRQDAQFDQIAETALFVANYLGDGSPLVIGSGLLMDSKKGVLTIDRRVDLKLRHFDSSTAPSYRMTSTDTSAPAQLYEVVFEVVQGIGSVLFTLNRFNLAFGRSNTHDKIVDATICLESMIPVDGELAFRFALYHSLIWQTDSAERRKAFDILRSLYAARSGIVHGDVSGKSRKKAIDSVLDNWDTIMEMMKKSIVHYLFFAQEVGFNDWRQYLEGIALGERPKYGEEPNGVR